jgi:hypothetical protein
MVRAIVTDQARLTRTIGVFADKCLSRLDRSRAARAKLNASEQGQARISIAINRAFAAQRRRS